MANSSRVWCFDPKKGKKTKYLIKKIILDLLIIAVLSNSDFTKILLLLNYAISWIFFCLNSNNKLIHYFCNKIFVELHNNFGVNILFSTYFPQKYKQESIKNEKWSYLFKAWLILLYLKAPLTILIWHSVMKKQYFDL